MRRCLQCGGRYEDAIAFCPSDGTPTEPVAAAESADPLVGTVIDGRYHVEQRIGEGGMGVVYRATHVVLKKLFALKVLRREQAGDASVVQRFVREARAASAIGHPNIVDIHDFGTTPDGAVYLAMEYLDGMTLAQAMRQGPLPYDRALELFVQIAGALEAAHAQGIIHRDLKPENIFLIRERDGHEFVKVLDFGIAKVKNAAAKITRTGLVFGTPHYMSPEQAAGQPVDHRSDIYSLGIIMYQVLAGQLPFSAESLMALITKHMFEPAPSLREAGCAVPAALDALVTRCLQKKPELRPSSMRELESELRRVQLSPRSRSHAPTPLPALSLAGSLAGAAPPAPFTATSETLEAALLANVSSAEDDEPIAVPKRRPLWLWVMAASVLAVLIALGIASSKPARPQVPAAADQSQRLVPASQLAGGGGPAWDELPRGVAEPLPTAAPAAASALPTAEPQPARARSQPTAASKTSTHMASDAPAARPKPRVSPAPSKPAVQHGESLIDPWR